MRIKLLLALFALAVVTVAPRAEAFPFIPSWHEPADGNVPPEIRGGAGGIYGTGSQQDWGIKCSHCHIDAPGMIDLEFVMLPDWQDVNGDPAYSPGERYTFTMNLIGEHLGLSMNPPDNRNGVNVVIEDAFGVTAGVYHTDSGVSSDNCPSAVWPDPPPFRLTTFVLGDCHGVVFAGTDVDILTSWTFDWVAPPAGTGDLTIYWGAVDGNTNDLSSLEDDVKEGVIQLREGT